jgi:dihydrofolate synthase/folylpolyglutamate synthase
MRQVRKMNDEYWACLDALYSRLNYERTDMPRGSGELRLGRMRRLLRELGDPQQASKIVHVAGTKGKGSTATLIAAALSATGVSTGLYCSPHLHGLEERFRIDGETISSQELTDLWNAVRPSVEALDRVAEITGVRGPTFFEVTTAMGLYLFASRGVGVVVLEVGMGGRLDSTNCVRPSVAVLTSISLDHTKQLGSTLGAIATEKAGIIKRACRVVSGVRGDEPRRAIERVVRQRRAHLRSIDHDYDFAYVPPTQPLSRPASGHVQVNTWRQDWGRFELPILGRHQGWNAATALAALDELAEQGIVAEPSAVRRGWQSVRLPARVEVLEERPWLVIDGAHNAASAEALAATIAECFPPATRTLVFGTTKDKDLVGQLRALVPLFDQVIITRYIENPRALPIEPAAARVLELTGQQPRTAAEPEEALALAREITSPKGLICVTGSLFLAAEARAAVLGLKSTARGQQIVT